MNVSNIGAFEDGAAKICSRIWRTVFGYGSIYHGAYKSLILRRDATLGTAFPHANEVSFTLDGDRFAFLNACGLVTCRMQYNRDANAFLPLDNFGAYLLPILELGEPPQAPSRTTKLIVATIPKSGTYLVDLVLRALGYQSLELHFNGTSLFDNRGVPEHQIHVAPRTREIFCPPSSIAEVMSPGEYAVGHIGDMEQIKLIGATSVHTVYCIRDLRDVIVSLFHFKLRTVAPADAADVIWRKASTAHDAFLGFLSYHLDKDIPYVLASARVIAEVEGIKLRFEDLAAGELSEENLQALDRIEPALGQEFQGALAASLGKDTATLSKRRANFEEFWSDDVQQFFEDSGLAAANAALGYSQKTGEPLPEIDSAEP